MRAVTLYRAARDGLRNIVTGALLVRPGGGTDPGSPKHSYVPISDRFEGGLSAWWSTTWGAPSVTGDRLVVPAGTGYPGVGSQPVSFTGRAVKVGVVAVPATAGTESVFQVRADATNHVSIALVTAQAGVTRIVARVVAGGVLTATDLGSWSATAHAWLQLREDAGQWRVEVSATGAATVASWSTLATVPSPFASGALLSFRINAGAFGTVPGSGNLVVEAVNDATGPTVGGLPRLVVAGSRIVTATGGADVLLRGVNVRNAEYKVTAPMDWSWDRRTLPIIKGWGGNVALYGFAVNPVNRGEAGYLDQGLDQLVAITRDAGMYLVLAVRSAERSEIGQPQYVGIPPAAAEDALAVLATRYRGESHVMFAAQVETNGVGADGVDYQGTSVQAWLNVRDYTERCVDKVRATGNQAIVFTSGLNFGRHVNHAVTYPVRRADVVYKTDVYNTIAAGVETPANFGAAVDAGLPVWIGEFGPWANGMTLADCQALMDYATRKRLGWAAWLNVPPSVLSHSIWLDDTATTVSPFGALVKDAIDGVAPISGGVTLAFFGDSITDSGSAQVASEWAKLTTGRTLTVHRHAVGGTSLAEVTPPTAPAHKTGGAYTWAMFQAHLAALPSGALVHLGWGTKDSWDTPSREGFKANLILLVEEVLRRGLVPVLPTITWKYDPASTSNSTWQNTQIVFCNDRIREVIASYGSRVRAGADLYAWSKDRTDLLAPDGLHFTTEGYRQWAEEVVERIAGVSTGAPTGVLWRPDLTAGTPAFRGATAINSGASASYPVVSGTTDPSGREMTITIPQGTAYDGVKIRTRFSDIPIAERDEIYASHEFWIPSGSGAFTSGTTKLFNGLFGLPAGQSVWNAATGGGSTSTDWSVRFLAMPPNYRSGKYGAHPAALAAYIYAAYANGTTQAQDTNGYGIEVPFRPNGTGTGNVLAIPSNQWVKLEVYVKVGPTDNRDGICRMWMNGQLVVDVNDVTWTAASGRQRINGWISETFHNKASAASTYRMRNFALTSARRWT